LLYKCALPLVGLALLFAAWQIAIMALSKSVPMAAYFAPSKAFEDGARLFSSGALYQHSIDSLRRVFYGLFWALVFGAPIGLLVGVSQVFERSSNLLFQFLRMISPLSLMPIAVIALGIGDAPIYFLLAFAGVWPIMINAAAGVKAIDAKWIRLARSMAATKTEILLRIILPGVLDHLLTGVRLAVGVIWIVLVPAEMLGVQAGIGYFILDCRDRMEYGELAAAILWIGVLGAALDFLARFLRQKLRRR
jgi:NitT/TauT family transport system permease protein